MSRAEVGVCDQCEQELILTDDDCWHPWSVERACPPEFVWPQIGVLFGDGPLRPGRKHWRAAEDPS